MWRCWLILFVLLASTFDVRATTYYYPARGATFTATGDVFGSDPGQVAAVTSVLNVGTKYFACWDGSNYRMVWSGTACSGGLTITASLGSCIGSDSFSSATGLCSTNVEGQGYTSSWGATYGAGSGGGGVMSALGLTDNELLSVLMIAALLLIYVIGFGVGQQR